MTKEIEEWKNTIQKEDWIGLGVIICIVCALLASEEYFMYYIVMRLLAQRNFRDHLLNWLGSCKLLFFFFISPFVLLMRPYAS